MSACVRAYGRAWPGRAWARGVRAAGDLVDLGRASEAGGSDAGRRASEASEASETERGRDSRAWTGSMGTSAEPPKLARVNTSLSRLAWPRLGTWLVSLVVGAVYGVAGTIGQAAAWGVLPVGLVVAIVGAAALLVAMRLLADRGAALATGLGAMGATLLFSGRGPGGSIVVPAAAEGALSTGLVWTIALPVLVALVAAWPVAAVRTTTN